MKRKLSVGQLDNFDTPFIEIMNHCSKLETIRLTNMVISDKSLRQISQALPRLKRLDIKNTETEKALTERSFNSICNLDLLETLHINYPNTFTENTLVDLLFRARHLKYLLLHGCKELIPIKEIFHAAVKQASRPDRRMLSLEVDIDTREKIYLEIMKTTFRPKNLIYTFSTGFDFFSTQYSSERPPPPAFQEDFDEVGNMWWPS